MKKREGQLTNDNEFIQLRL